MKLLIGLLLLGTVLSAFASDKVLECEAKATMKDKVLFEIQSDFYNHKVVSQGTTISDFTKRE